MVFFAVVRLSVRLRAKAFVALILIFVTRKIQVNRSLPIIAVLLAISIAFASGCAEPQLVQSPARAVQTMGTLDAEKEKCLERVRLCQQECERLFPVQSPAWTGCRVNCGNAGSCG